MYNEKNVANDKNRGTHSESLPIFLNYSQIKWLLNSVSGLELAISAEYLGLVPRTHPVGNNCLEQQTKDLMPSPGLIHAHTKQNTPWASKDLNPLSELMQRT